MKKNLETIEEETKNGDRLTLFLRSLYNPSFLEPLKLTRMDARDEPEGWISFISQNEKEYCVLYELSTDTGHLLRIPYDKKGNNSRISPYAMVHSYEKIE